MMIGFANKAINGGAGMVQEKLSRMLEQEFSSGVDNPSTMNSLVIPAVLDWTFGDSSCEEAKHRPAKNPWQLPETYPCYGICINEIGSYQCVSSKESFAASGVVITGAGIGIGIGIGLLALLLGTAFLIYKLKARRARKLRDNFCKRNRGLLLQQLISSNKDIADRMRIFSLKELEKANQRFRQDPNSRPRRPRHGLQGNPAGPTSRRYLKSPKS